MNFTLEKYQGRGVRHLMASPYSGLLMDPGTGKTLTVLAAFYELKRRNLVDRLLVAAPLNAAYEVWPAEVQKWGFPFRCEILHGLKKAEAAEREADIYSMNYEGFGWFFGTNAHRHVMDGKRVWLVMDESTKLKNTSSQRFKTLAPHLGRFARRSALTGTPAPKSLLDLFGQVKAMDLGERLGRYITQYRREYFYSTGYGGYTWAPQEGAEERIYKALDGLFYRVSDEVLGLKKPRYVERWVSLDPKARSLYEKLERDCIHEFSNRSKVTAVNAGVLTQKLRQIANGAVHDAKGRIQQVHTAKVDEIEELVESLQGNPLLVGYEFTNDGERLAKRLDAPMIKGGMNRAEVKRLFAQLNAGKLHALICQASAAAHGLNLQEACHDVSWFGLPWNLETYIQFNRRVHRKGQKHRVTIHQVLARDTVDELTLSTALKKGATQDKLLAALMKHWLVRSKK